MNKQKETKTLEQELSVVSDYSAGIVDYVTTLSVEDQDSEAIAGIILAEIKGHEKTIDEKRRYYTAPMDEIIKKLNDTARLILSPLLKAKSILIGKMRDYDRQKEEKRLKELSAAQKKIEKAVESGRPIPIIQVTPVAKTIKTEQTTVTYRDNWVAEVLDKRMFIEYCIAENMFDLLEISTTGLNKLAKLVKDQKIIKGIKIENKKVISNR